MTDWTLQRAYANPDVWAKQRAQYLNSTDVGLRETIAETVAYAHLGYSESGIAKKLDTTSSTARSRLDTADANYPGITTLTVVDIHADPSCPVDVLPTLPPNECPVCTKQSLTTPAGARTMYRTNDWGATSMLDDASLVCSVCHAVRIDGEWQRMETVASRAYNLARASSSKSRKDYRDILTAGMDLKSRSRNTTEAEAW